MTLLNLHLYQIVVTIIAAAMIIHGLTRFAKKEGTQTLFKLGVRMVVWGGMMLVALFPRITDKIADAIGLEGNINAVILTGFLLIFLIVFKLLSAVEKLEAKIAILARKDSLKKIKKKKRNNQ